MPAEDGMQEYVRPLTESVVTNMSALVAEDTLSPLASEEPKRRWEILEGRGRFERRDDGWEGGEGDAGFAPKYKRGFVFFGGGHWN